MNIEQRKLLIVELLAELQDEAVIRQIENLLTPKTDFWDELSQKEKSLIKKGLEQLDKGEKMEYRAFLSAYLDKKSNRTDNAA